MDCKGIGHEAEMATRSTFYLDGQWHIGPSYYSAESKWQNESHTASDVRDRIIRVKSYQIINIMHLLRCIGAAA